MGKELGVNSKQDEQEIIQELVDMEVMDRAQIKKQVEVGVKDIH